MEATVEQVDKTSKLTCVIGMNSGVWFVTVPVTGRLNRVGQSLAPTSADYLDDDVEHRHRDALI